MFARLFTQPKTLAHQRDGPLVEERLRYLSFRADQGMTRITLQEMARFLLVVAEALRLADRPGEVISHREIEQRARSWAEQSGPCKAEQAGRRQRLFHQHAVQWLGFLGRLQPLPATPHPHAELIEAFADYLCHEKELAPGSVAHCCATARTFLSWLRTAKASLQKITVPQIDTAFVELFTRRDYTRVTMQRCAGNLRTFLRYAERRGLCRAGLEAAIKVPRIFTLRTLPCGPTWDEVRQVFSLVEGDRPVEVRDRAILMLLAVYGLRAGEIVRLRLEDIDWDRELLTVTRPKSRRSQTYPLSRSVAAALVRYLKEVRPRTALREVFLTRRAPVRRIHRCTVYLIVSRRLRAVRPSLPHHGPHALRHACATHLLEQGLSLKEIGDHLGHLHPDTTRIYTKVDLTGLRQVADFDLGGLL